MVLWFDQVYVIKEAMTNILGREVMMTIYTDSKCLFDALTNLNTTSEKRLMIDLSMLRESYERREITSVMWVPGCQNPADAMTKRDACAGLEKLIAMNKIEVTPSAWIERNMKPPAWSKIRTETKYMGTKNVIPQQPRRSQKYPGRVSAHHKQL